MIDTDESLLKQVRQLDAHDAWQVFFQRYWQVILRYSRKLGLNQHQAEEVLQETMVELMRILPEFDYDRRKGRFRNFLLTIVHRKALRGLRQIRQSARLQAIGDTEVSDVADNENLAEAEKRWRESIRDTLLTRLNHGCDQLTLAIFRAYVLEDRPAAEVAQNHGVEINAVYQIKSRLTRRLQKDTEAWLRDSELG